VPPEARTTSPIRVLQLGSPTGMFGAERWILALARHLPPADVHTTIGVIQDSGSAVPELCVHAARLGFDTVSIQAPGRLSRDAIPQLRALIRERHIDVLNTHFYKSTILGAMAVRGTSCSLVVTPHGWSADAGFRLQVYEWLDRIAFGWADAVSPLSPELERGLRRLPWVASRLHPIRNGVDLAEVGASDAIDADVARARRDGGFVVGYVGQLIARKRIDTLIDAFAALEVPDKWLFLVGDGPQRPELEARARAAGVSDRVRFAGFREDRLALLCGFHAIVLPSSLEGIPRCLMEAMAAGVAMVSSDIEGSRELVIHEQTGLMFPTGHSGALTACLGRLASDDSLRSRLVAAARQRVDTEFSAAAMAGRYVQLYRSVRGVPQTAVRPLAPVPEPTDPVHRGQQP
jgi:glycosyltransferase involved in cell wall biosynthesis